MRLPADFAWVRIGIAIAGAFVLGATGALVQARDDVHESISVNGPRADYPVVTGEPYEVGDVTYSPADVMNYDAVGFAAQDAGATGITGSHHTLPLPSYVEVTSLETGRTILVRLERRGPMASNELVALSEGALSELGAGPGIPIRVRRVNPQEFERARLRAGEMAPARIDTPMSLVEVLRRKLAVPTAVIGDTIEPLIATPAEADVVPTSQEPADVVGTSPRFMVQAASFSTKARADNAARALNGAVTPSGIYFRVRTGPFATRGEAEASLAKVQAAGYTDARIYTSG